MKAIYIGGERNTKPSGIKWKLYLFLITFLAITIGVLKVTGPTIVENWINEKGASSLGYAFSIRNADISISKGQVALNDVKVFNPKTNTEILETPQLTVKLNWVEIIREEEKKVSLEADQVILTLSDDLTSEIKRVEALQERKNLLQLAQVDGKITQLNIIEKKDDLSRTVVELKDVDLKVNQVTPQSISNKSEFNLTSTIADGGKLNLSGKITEANGSTPWTIQGTLKQVPAEVLNKIAGQKLPFTFNEATLNAQISAHTEAGKVSGEIVPDIKKLNLIEEKPGIPTQVIARALTEELTFSLPFTLQEGVAFQYAETFSRLKNYRKYAGTPVDTQPANDKKPASFWPF